MSTLIISLDNATTFLEMLFPKDKYWEDFIISIMDGLTKECDVNTSYCSHDDMYLDRDELLAFAVSYSQGSMPEEVIESSFNDFNQNLYTRDPFGLNIKIDLVLSALDRDDVHINSSQDMDVNQSDLFTKIKGVVRAARNQAKKAQLTVERADSVLKLLKEKLAHDNSKNLFTEGEAV